MGEVRSTLENKTGKSPISKLAEVKEQLYDLIQIKMRDLEQEGESAKNRNGRALDSLRSAVAYVTEAENALRAY